MLNRFITTLVFAILGGYGAAQDLPLVQKEHNLPAIEHNQGLPKPEPETAQKEEKSEVTEFDNLASDNFQEREISQQKLMAWAEPRGRVGLALVLKMFVAQDDPELQHRLHGCLYTLHRLMPKGLVGIRMQDSPRNGFQNGGVVVTNVEFGTPAEKAGLQVNDLILEVNGINLNQREATLFFSNEIKSYFAGDTVELKVLSKNNIRKVKLVLGEFPSLDERLKIIPQQGLLFNREMILQQEALQHRAQFERWMEREIESLQTKKTP